MFDSFGHAGGLDERLKYLVRVSTGHDPRDRESKGLLVHRGTISPDTAEKTCWHVAQHVERLDIMRMVKSIIRLGKRRPGGAVTQLHYQLEELATKAWGEQAGLQIGGADGDRAYLSIKR